MPIGYRRSDVSVTDIRHDLFVYETDAELAAQIERYVVAGLEADEAVTVAVSAGKQRLLRDALGQAADFVSFRGTGDVYTRPEAAMAACEASLRKSEEVLDAGLRVYGELPICGTQAEWNRWMAYESLANRVFAHRPVVLMCGYDRRVVPEAVVHQAWQTHRVVHASVWQLSREYEEPEVLVPSLEPPFEPLPGLPLAADRGRSSGGPSRGRADSPGRSRGSCPGSAGGSARGADQRRALRQWRARLPRRSRRRALRLRDQRCRSRIGRSVRRLPAACAAGAAKEQGSGSHGS